jgi:Uma2 family endonuclease
MIAERGMTYHAAMPETRLITADEFLAMDRPWCELIRGEIVEVNPPGRRACEVTARIAHILLEHVEDAGEGTVLTGEPGFKLESDPDLVRAPDVAYVRLDRLEGQDRSKYPTVAPDLAVEVVSPSDTFAAVEEKAAMWLSYGTRLVWVVEPEKEQVFVYRAGEPRISLGEGEEVTGGDVLPGLAVRIHRLFG